MKKVAGTLKLDQAQFRELEAFSKFGSDLDAATTAVLEKGKRNLEILKQNQYSPLTVEHQIAIIFCGTNNLLRNIPITSVRKFQTSFLLELDTHHSDLLKALKAGKYDNDIAARLTEVAKSVASSYES
jgi:F-type H+-transporting ATPase subunit alpha